MHGLSIALSLLELVEDEAARRECRVAAIHLRLGPLSGVLKDALGSAYELAREGATLARAELVVEETCVRVHCAVCAAERGLPSASELCCPVCGTPTPNVIAGRELELVAIEVES